MRHQAFIGFGLAALLSCGTASAQDNNPARAQGNPLQKFLQLDGNNDKAVERSEVPEAAADAFEDLLKHGDANKDGKLQFDELRDLGRKLQALGPPPGGEDRFKAQDKDNDGKVSRAEFQGPAPMFDRLDANNDGFLEPGEVRRAQLAGEAAPPNPMLRGRIQKMDQNKDGKITREEFQGPQLLFKSLDRDGDGVVTSNELNRVAPDANAPKPTPESAKEIKQPEKPRNDPSPAAPKGNGDRLERLKKMDKNQDGTITRAEFDGPPALFSRIDSDDNGKITQDEIKAAVKKLRDGAPGKKVAKGKKGN